MESSPVMQKFILHWGEMGTHWGINRSVAQIHALLYLEGRPVPADELVERLAIARSNVSMSLKELLGWGLVRVVHRPGDRREHYETLADVWEMFSVILRERKRREFDPTLRLVQECVEESAATEAAQQPARHQRLLAMQEFLELTGSWGSRATALPARRLHRLAQLGDSIFKLLE
jgi:DNA-binding transcriptional regulator GbsR (MarR family)